MMISRAPISMSSVAMLMPALPAPLMTKRALPSSLFTRRKALRMPALTTIAVPC